MASSDAEKASENILPGLGLPADHMASDGFRNAFRVHADGDQCAANGVCLREKRMMAFINEITDKPDWERKVFDEGIVAKWKSEADSQPRVGRDVYMSDEMFNFVSLGLLSFPALASLRTPRELCLY